MKSIVFTLSASVVLLAFQGLSWGQLIPTGDQRCAGNSAITAQVAQQRYGWALHCAKHPIFGRDPHNWLTSDSNSAYNDPANASLQSRLYPAYLNMNPFGLWDVPANAGLDCTLLPSQATNVGLCLAGCYPADAVVSFSDGDVAIREARDQRRVDLITLSQNATLDKLEYITNTVAAYSVDIVDSWQTIYTFNTTNGNTLRVTDEHPVLVHTGKIRQAKTLEIGDRLVRADGSTDAISSISVERLFGKVYNVRPTTLDYATNIVVAQGYLNGSSRYQNEFLDMVNRVILRRALSRLPLGNEPPTPDEQTTVSERSE